MEVIVESVEGENAGAASVPRYWASQHVYVDNVGSKITNKAEIVSPQFFSREDPHPTFFRMELSFGSEVNNHLSIWIRSVSRKITVTSTNALVQQSNSGGKIIDQVSDSHKDVIEKDRVQGWEKFLEFPLLESENVNWHVIIELEYEGTSSNPDSVAIPSDPNLNGDFNKLFDNGHLADVTFTIQGEKVMAHKCILLARCAYFEGMFLSDMKENQTNEIEIPDFTPDVFKELLKFLYSGQPSKYSCNETMELFTAADKYGVDLLKENCESLLCSNLTTENVIEVLFLADEYNSSDMKECAMTFVKIHYWNMKEESRNRLQTRPNLLQELFASNLAPNPALKD